MLSCLSQQTETDTKAAAAKSAAAAKEAVKEVNRLAEVSALESHRVAQLAQGAALLAVQQQQAATFAQLAMVLMASVQKP